MDDGQKILYRLEPKWVIAALWQGYKRAMSKPNPNSGVYKNESGFWVHTKGAIGEKLFTIRHPGRLNWKTLPEGDGHHFDVHCYNGDDVEVKTSYYTGDDVDLKFEANEVGKSPFCGLVQFNALDTGWVFPYWSWEFILSRLEPRNYGYGPRQTFRPRCRRYDPFNLDPQRKKKPCFPTK